jgi:hypothetical protein
MIQGKLFSEIFDEFQKATTKQERIAVLRRYDHPTFRDFLLYAFSPKVVFDVEVPNYRPAPEPAGLNFTYLDLEVNKLYRFIKNHPKRPEGLSPEKQKQLLVVVLESLYKDEAQILANVLKKKFEVPYLTVNLINEVYPNLIR